jgi:DNA-binding MurR/RpiR family transcriptional regulator
MATKKTVREADALPTGAPRSLGDLQARIAAAGAALTPRVREAARHAIEHPNDMALNSVAQMAEQSGIAASAFIRMAQALGFAGYSELQGLFAESLQRAALPSYRERFRHHGGEVAIEDSGDPRALLCAFSQANLVSLEHLRDEAATLPLEAAIRLLSDARNVYVLGLRRSFAVATYLAYALARVGRPCVHITGSGGAIVEQARAVQRGDVLLVISFPPYAPDTLAICEQVKAVGGQRLAITDTALGPVARDARVVLQVNDAELLGFRSLTSAMCLAQTLAMGLAFQHRRGRIRKDSKAQVTLALEDIDC